MAESERRHLIRVDSGKVNLVPPAEAATWFRLVGVKLGNETADYPDGDEVQTVEPWSPTDIWCVINSALANHTLDKIEGGLPDGSRYSDAPNAAKERAAWRVIKAVAPELSKEQCRKAIATWVENGVLRKGEYRQPTQRKPRMGLFVNATKRPGNRDD